MKLDFESLVAGQKYWQSFVTKNGRDQDVPTDLFSTKREAVADGRESARAAQDRGERLQFHTRRFVADGPGIAHTV